MATYVADAVAMNRRLIGAEPARVAAVFDRARRGLDSLLATPVQLAEVADTFTRRDEIAGTTPSLTGREAVRTLLDGPVDSAPVDRAVLLRLDRLFDYYSIHDAVLVAAHETLDADGIVTNDREIETFDGDAAVWS